MKLLVGDMNENLYLEENGLILSIYSHKMYSTAGTQKPFPVERQMKIKPNLVQTICLVLFRTVNNGFNAQVIFFTQEIKIVLVSQKLIF